MRKPRLGAGSNALANATAEGLTKWHSTTFRKVEIGGATTVRPNASRPDYDLPQGEISTATLGGPAMHLSRHAAQRARSRGLSRRDLGLVLLYGRSCYVRGAEIRFVGRRETRRNTAVPRLLKVEGVHVVCSM